MNSDNKTNNIILTKKMYRSRTDHDFYIKYINNNINSLNLVLDLDNTLIYTKIVEVKKENFINRMFDKINTEDLLIKFIIEDKIYYVYKRQYLRYFLTLLNINFNLYIYTNSTKIYSEQIINSLLKRYNNIKIKKVIYKKSQDSTNIKNLEFLFYDSIDIEYYKNTIIIDDRDDIWPFDKKNLIKIISYNCRKQDNELLHLINILLDIKICYDKLKKNKNFNIQKILNYYI